MATDASKVAAGESMFPPRVFGEPEERETPPGKPEKGDRDGKNPWFNNRFKERKTNNEDKWNKFRRKTWRDKDDDDNDDNKKDKDDDDNDDKKKDKDDDDNDDKKKDRDD